MPPKDEGINRLAETEPDKTTPKAAPGPLRHPLLIGTLLLIILSLFLIPERAPPEIDPALRRTLDQLASVSAAIDEDFTALTELRHADDADAQAAEIEALEAAITARRREAGRLWQDIGALMELPPPWHDSAHLIRFPTQPVQRHNYNQVYHPIEGPQPGKMPGGFSFRFDRIIPLPDGSLLHRLDQRAGAAIKWEKELQRGRTEGHYVVEATINHVRPGVVYAPLWLFAEGPEEWGHEYDFEIMDGRLEYNLHNGSGGFNMRRVEKDLSGHRMRYEIIRRPGRVTMRATSLTEAWSDELVITPDMVADWAGQDGAPENLRFPPDHVSMYPVTELWRCRWPDWCGRWRALPPGRYVEMTVHGYRVDP